MSKNMNKRATKRKSATENSILKFLAVSSVFSDSIVKGIIDDIIKMAVKTAEVDDRSLLTSMLRKANIRYPSDVYALSFKKYKGSNYGEFLKDYYIHDSTSTLRIWKVC
jgi:hypothetical protein